MELTIGIILVVGFLVVLRARKNKTNGSKEISSTVLPLPPKPPTGTPT